ncbi:MAG: sugar transferase [Proteobacteria bacterium SG_bin6]|nr:MAG: sugar transferase [Proteobacteria bacterium SG_bin6]
MLMIRQDGAVGGRHASWLDSLRSQLLLGLAVAVLLPGFFFSGDERYHATSNSVFNSFYGSAIAFSAGLAMLRRMSTFPGTGYFAFIIPSFTATYGLVVTSLFALRLNYSGTYLGTSFVVALAVAFLFSFWVARFSRPSFYLVPSPRTLALAATLDADLIALTTPELPAGRRAAIVADLRHDHKDDWERFLAQAAINGYPVYHWKLLTESLTGRVNIEHLSENSFGSLLPNLAYRKAKRVIDIIASLLVLPLLALPIAIVALLIKLDSPGPVLFVQERMGFRGRPFRMVKFRTMRPRPICIDQADAINDAMTKSDDDRITRIGRFLRRTRIDELPQIWNILRGEMSWIGPRPEAVALSGWYENEIPFYSYRHIVRPGITGWAQVNQGHVTDLDSINEKLTYDFYYIKYFSAWLDVVVALRTVTIMATGFGSK